MLINSPMKLARLKQKLEIVVLTERSFVHKIVAVVLLLLAAELLTYFAYVSTNHHFPTIGVLAVVLTAIYTDLFSSLIVAIVLKFTGEYYFTPPFGFHFTDVEFERLFVSILIASCVSVLITFLRISLSDTIKAKKEAEHAKQEAEHAKQEAEHAKLLMEKVLALVSHDIRNPLGVVKMGSQMILEEPSKAEENRPILVMMIRNLGQIDSMIESLLDVTRIKAGKAIPLDFETSDLAVEVGRIIEVQSFTEKNRINFTSIDSIWGSWGVSGICRVLQNLISNAVKYGAPSSPIEVVLERKGECAILSVHNMGNEIPLEDQKDLFVAFQRTPRTEGGRIKGWGLGLALVKGIAESHYGAVRVESGRGKGTTFILELPIRVLSKLVGKESTSQYAFHKDSNLQS